MKPLNAQKVFNHILDQYAFTGEIASQVQIAKDMGMPYIAVQRAFRQLKKRGLLIPGYKPGKYVIARERWSE